MKLLSRFIVWSLLGVFFLLVVLSTSLKAELLGCWDSSLTNMPTARRASAAVELGGYIYVIGGRTGGPGLGDDTAVVERYDASDGSWETMPSLNTARAWLVAAAVGGNIYAIGGSNTGGKLATVEEYIPGALSWTYVDSMNYARDDAVVGVLNNKIYVIGGHGPYPGPSLEVLDLVEEFDPAVDPVGNWTTMTSMPVKRSMAASGMVNDIIYVMGGVDGVYGSQPDTYEYDPATDTWTPTPKTPMPDPRSRMTAGVINDKIYVIGGYNEHGAGILDEVITYDPDLDRWEVDDNVPPDPNWWENKSAMPTPRGEISSAVAGGLVYVFGGRDAISDTGNILADTGAADFLCLNIEVSITADPSDLPEPGGDVTFTVRVTNTGTTNNVYLNSLVDDHHGNLFTLPSSTCVIDQLIPVGNLYECTFSATFANKQSGFSETDTVTAIAYDASWTNRVLATDSATVTITDVVPSITVGKTANPTSVPEPGGNVTFTVTVTNTGTEDATLDALVDEVNGVEDNLFDSLGKICESGSTCVEDMTIPFGNSCQCTFTATISGNGGDSETDTVTATVSDDEANFVQADGSATVAITGMNIEVDKTASPGRMLEPGGEVTFTVTVTNTGTEDATLDALVDEVNGIEDDLFDSSGKTCESGSTCVKGMTIPSGNSCQCAFTATISGSGGDSETDTVTATVSDDEANSIQADDSATVEIIKGGFLQAIYLLLL